MENKLNEFEGKEILKSDEAAKLLGITTFPLCVVRDYVAHIIKLHKAYERGRTLEITNKPALRMSGC